MNQHLRDLSLGLPNLNFTNAADIRDLAAALGIHEVEIEMVNIITAASDARYQKTKSIAVEAALYHLGTGGNRTRARICVEGSKALQLEKNDVIALAACVELLHNASLIHDDLHDHEKSRHEKKSVWVQYSPDVAVCAGDLMISCAYVAISSVSKPEILPSLLRSIHRSISNAIQGQCEDLKVRHENALSVDDYVRIVKAKSGALLALPLELSLLLSGDITASERSIRAAEDFSVGYQIKDDLSDVKEDLGGEEKPAGLNIITVMNQIGQYPDAEEEVKTLARSYFHSSHAIAGELPHGSGQFLQKLSLQMAQSL